MSIASAGEQRIGNRRWMIGLLFGAGVLVNYFDRVNLSVAGPILQRELGFGPEKFGLLSSAFFWTYAILQIPTGVLLDRYGVTIIGRIGTTLWGAASALTACASGYWGVLVSRGLLGIAEAPAFPVSSKGTGYWFPRRERALATSIFDAAAKFSNVIGVPLVAFFMVQLGWRWGFGVTSAMSFAYAIAFYFLYRDPSADTKIGAAERAYIQQGGATPEGSAPASAAGMFVYLLSQAKVWGLAIGFAAYGYSFYMYLTWLPGYLVSTFHMNIMKSAGYAAVIWSVATVTDLVVGGWLVDYLIARGGDETRVRKTVLVAGMILGLAVFGAARTTSLSWAIVWLSVALGGLAFAAPVGWSLPSLIAPKGGVGTIGGIMNCANNLVGGALAPAVTGFIVFRTGSFAAAFIVAGGVLLLGILSFVFILGKVEPIADPAESSSR
jgi:MFS transporter, ACS family, D-galactonate transporter